MNQWSKLPTKQLRQNLKSIHNKAQREHPRIKEIRGRPPGAVACLEGFKATNECVDDFSKVNVPKITNDLVIAVNTLDILHYTVWAAAILTVLEFMWLIPCGETVR